MSARPCGCDPEAKNHACDEHAVDVGPVRIRLEPVRSSLIAAIGHDADTKLLVVEFKAKSSRYAYANVPREKYERLLTAPSVGAALAQEIKAGGYESTRLDDARGGR